jgi:hypothetical protein
VGKTRTKKDQLIPVFGISGDTGERGWFRRSSDMEYGREFVSTKVLQTEIAKIASRMDEMLEKLPQTKSEFQISTVTFSLEISAKGTVSLLGSGGEVAGKGGLVVTVTRHIKKDDKK